MKAGHTEEYVDKTSAAPWPQLDGVRPKTSPALVDDGRRSEEDGEGRGGAKYNNMHQNVQPLKRLLSPHAKLCRTQHRPIWL